MLKNRLELALLEAPWASQLLLGGGHPGQHPGAGCLEPHRFSRALEPPLGLWFVYVFVFGL
jgi:hypothetical protein